MLWRTAALFGLLLFAPDANAWKVTTHMVVTERGATNVKDDALRQLLLNPSNIDDLRGGAIGPDIFYFPYSNLSFLVQKLTGYQYDPAFSDLAHYCQTDELARNMLASAKSDREKAFAYGWLAHNLEDSVAHAWVNGFVGAPFKIGATLNWTQPFCRELAQALRLALWPDLFMLHAAERALDPTGESS